MIRLLPLLLLLNACAPMEARSLICFGWCAQQEMKKGALPGKTPESRAVAPSEPPCDESIVPQPTQPLKS